MDAPKEVLKRDWRGKLLVAAVAAIFIILGLAIWAVVLDEDPEEATLENVEQLLVHVEQLVVDVKGLSEDDVVLNKRVEDLQKRVQLELLLHRCRKEQIMELLLREHGIPIPADPHPIDCPRILNTPPPRR